MNVQDVEDRVRALITKATSTEKSEDALRFSQAALNVAHISITLASAAIKPED